MGKIHIGDYVYVEYLHKNGTVVGDRGGHVGRYTIKCDDGECIYSSSRDCTVIKPARPCYPNSRASIEQKLDLLLEHLGLEIDDSIRIVKRGETNDEEATS